MVKEKNGPINNTHFLKSCTKRKGPSCCKILKNFSIDNIMCVLVCVHVCVSLGCYGVFCCMEI